MLLVEVLTGFSIRSGDPAPDRTETPDSGYATSLSSDVRVLPLGAPAAVLIFLFLLRVCELFPEGFGVFGSG